MRDIDLGTISTIDLLKNYGNILDELRRRKVLRTSNNPIGDYAEWLVAQKLNFMLEKSSKSGYDCIGKDNLRYQIKSRRNTSHNKSREFSVIRNYNNNDFDFLIALIFNEDFSVKEAYMISHDVVPKYSSYSAHVNGYKLILPLNMINKNDVENIINAFN